MAIKTLFSNHGKLEQSIKEANAMSMLNHKHIIQLYGIVLSEPFMMVSVCVCVSDMRCIQLIVAVSLSFSYDHAYVCVCICVCVCVCLGLLQIPRD